MTGQHDEQTWTITREQLTAAIPNVSPDDLATVEGIADAILSQLTPDVQPSAELVAAYHDLYDLVWNRVGAFESDDPKYSLVSYDDQSRMDGACIRIERLLAARDERLQSGEQMLREFLTAARPYHGDGPSGELWMKLIREEVNELAGALADDDRVAIADALADILYNLHGVALMYSIPLAQVLAEVHRSNMTKLIEPVAVRPDGKIIKGPNFEPPRIADVLGTGGLQSGHGDNHHDEHVPGCPLITQTCTRCGCTGYRTGDGCSDCYCHDEYPVPCAQCGGPEGSGPLLDPDCRDGKHTSCAGPPCECDCHGLCGCHEPPRLMIAHQMPAARDAGLQSGHGDGSAASSEPAGHDDGGEPDA